MGINKGINFNHTKDRVRLKIVRNQPYFLSWKKTEKSCFALELNKKKKVCLQQPAMFCLSNSNIDNKNSEK